MSVGVLCIADSPGQVLTNLRGHHVDTALVVGGEAGLLRGDVARDLNLHCQLLVREAADQDLLGDEVPAVGGFDTPVDIPRRQRDAVRARVHVRRLGAVPVADRFAVVHGGEPLVRLGEGRFIQVTDELACVQVQGEDGAILCVFCDESLAASSEGLVDFDTVELQLGKP